MQVLEGASSLAPPSAEERAVLEREGAGSDVRLTCLALLVGDAPVVFRVGGATWRLEPPVSR